MTVLNHNESHTFDNLIQLTPVSSGYHIGSSCWRLQIAHLNVSVVTNASIGVDYRHPKKFAADSLDNADLLLMSGFATKADTVPYY